MMATIVRDSGYGSFARPAVKAPARTFAGWLQVALSAVLLASFAREAFSGAGRYYLDILQFGQLWFIPDVLLMLIIVAQLVHYVVTGKPVLVQRALCFIVLMILPIIMALMEHIPPTAIISGVKIWQVIVGALMLRFNNVRGRIWTISVYGIFAASLLAILVNTRHAMPWYGYSFDQGGVLRDAARQSWVGGEDRLTGLSTSSFGAGCSLLLCALLINLDDERLWRKLIIYGLAIVGATITTALTPTIGLVIACIVDVWLHVTNQLSGKKQSPFARSILGILSISVVIVPFVVAVVYLNETQLSFDVGRFNSLMVRMFYSWPTALSLLVDAHYWNYLLGLGYGQVGTSAVYSGNYLWSAGAVDNLAIYVICTYGLVGVAVMIWLCRTLVRVSVSLIPAAFSCCAMILTVNCENPVAQLLLGFTITSVLAHARSYVPTSGGPGTRPQRASKLLSQ